MQPDPRHRNPLTLLYYTFVAALALCTPADAAKGSRLRGPRSPDAGHGDYSSRYQYMLHDVELSQTPFIYDVFFTSASLLKVDLHPYADQKIGEADAVLASCMKLTNDILGRKHWYNLAGVCDPSAPGRDIDDITKQAQQLRELGQTKDCVTRIKGSPVQLFHLDCLIREHPSLDPRHRLNAQDRRDGESGGSPSKRLTDAMTRSCSSSLDGNFPETTCPPKRRQAPRRPHDDNYDYRTGVGWEVKEEEEDVPKPTL